MKIKQTVKDNRGNREDSKFKFSWTWVYLVLLGGILSLQLLNSAPVKEITWQEFEKNLLSHKLVERVEVVNKERVEVYLKPNLASDPRFKELFKPAFGNGITKNPQYAFNIASVDSFERKMDEAQKGFGEKIPVNYKQQSSWFLNMLGWMLPFVFFYLLFGYLIRRFSGQDVTSRGTSIFNFGKSTATLIEKESSTITFDDVAGLDEARVEVIEIVEFLKNPGSFTKLGAKIPKGVILVGPPGTGKTLLAKAVAGEAKVPFFSISGSAFVEMFVGVGASRVRDLFHQAKQKAPCIIFIDEIDAIGRSRGKGAFIGGANDERESTLNQLLTEMDGFGTNTGVIVLAATNRGDMLDPALIRPGRFDRHIYLELPNLNERKAIFLVHMRKLILDQSIDRSILAAQTPGFSGADIANICNEAALIAARRKAAKISIEDFINAIDRTVAGLEKKSKIISAAERKIIAYHEAGHAVVSWLLKQIDPLVKVSIIPRGKSLGAAWYLPEEKQLKTESSFKENLQAILAGRASEEIIFGEVSSGALDDLEKASKEAYMMIVYYGFSKNLGHVSYFDSTQQHDLAIQKPFSEDTGRLIDQEIRVLISDAYREARTLLEAHKLFLKNVAELLLIKEVIHKQDLEEIMGKRG